VSEQKTNMWASVNGGVLK